MTKQTPPDAVMLLGTRCPHCPGVLKHLSQLIKSGELGRLRVINLEQHPKDAQEYGVRSVPWVKIGKYELSGAQDMAALQQRIKWANKDLLAKEDHLATDGSMAGKFDFWLSEALVDKAIAHIKSRPESISSIMELLGDSATVLSTRIGIGVIMEEFEGSQMIKQLIPELAKLASHKDPRIRSDSLHYLALTGSKKAIPILEQHTHDKDPEVSEVATDSLQELRNIPKNTS